MIRPRNQGNPAGAGVAFEDASGVSVVGGYQEMNNYNNNN
jgi:hypothetical protein